MRPEAYPRDAVLGPFTISHYVTYRLVSILLSIMALILSPYSEYSFRTREARRWRRQ